MKKIILILFLVLICQDSFCQFKPFDWFEKKAKTNLPYEPEFTIYRNFVLSQEGGQIRNEDSVKNAFTWIKANGGFISGKYYYNAYWGRLVTEGLSTHLFGINNELSVNRQNMTDLMQGVKEESFLIYNKNLRDCNFYNLSLNDMFLQDYDFTGSGFSNTIFTGSDLSNSNFTTLKLFTNITINSSNWTGAYGFEAHQFDNGVDISICPFYWTDFGGNYTCYSNCPGGCE